MRRHARTRVTCGRFTDINTREEQKKKPPKPPQNPNTTVRVLPLAERSFLPRSPQKAAGMTPALHQGWGVEGRRNEGQQIPGVVRGG